MKFTDIIGQQVIKNHLIDTIADGRVPHAQLFLGPEGSGTLAMAIAYAQMLICKPAKNAQSDVNTACDAKFENFQHPDLHFVFPVVTSDSNKNKSTSDAFFQEWITFLKETPYGGISEWNEMLDVKNKQSLIAVSEATNILKKMALKAYEGGYKVMIIWMADRMNIETSNKLLKIVEEPPKDTVFLLIAEDEKSILPTILSRCQVIHFPSLQRNEIEEHLLKKFSLNPEEARLIAKQSQGNYNKAMQILREADTNVPFEKWFITWVRAAFRANKNAKVVSELVAWSEELSAIGREKQKMFLQYCIEMFRQALFLNYQAEDLVFLQPKTENFKLEKFAPFVNHQNIFEIFEELSKAIYHIERNGNPKIIFTDLSIKLTRLIHRK